MASEMEKPRGVVAALDLEVEPYMMTRCSSRYWVREGKPNRGLTLLDCSHLKTETGVSMSWSLTAGPGQR